ncbi:hypothetical protein WA016_01988 [Myxococcus stipitatus]
MGRVQNLVSWVRRGAGAWIETLPCCLYGANSRWRRPSRCAGPRAPQAPRARRSAGLESRAAALAMQELAAGKARATLGCTSGRDEWPGGRPGRGTNVVSISSTNSDNSAPMPRRPTSSTKSSTSATNGSPPSFLSKTGASSSSTAPRHRLSQTAPCTRGCSSASPASLIAPMRSKTSTRPELQPLRNIAVGRRRALVIALLAASLPAILAHATKTLRLFNVVSTMPPSTELIPQPGQLSARGDP